MNRILMVVLSALLAVIVLLGAFVLYQRLSAQFGTTQTPAESTADTEPQKQLEKAPDFTVYDQDGNTVSLSDYAGKPVVVNFWASWCGPCKNELPHFQSAFDQYGEEVQFLMVNLTGGGNDTKENADQLIASGNYTFPVFYDTGNSASAAYSIYSMPVTIVVDRDGNLAGKQVGALDAERLANLIALVYTEK